jgi:hypothetical protein
MSRIIITMSRATFFRLLAHAPEELQREAKEDAKRAIPSLRLHGRRRPGKVCARGAMGWEARRRRTRGRPVADGRWRVR